MRSIIMNVLLTIGYDKYVVDIEKAAKVMALLSDAKSVRFACGDEDEGTNDRWVKCRTNFEICNLGYPVTDA
jgi:hypothetical protein